MHTPLRSKGRLTRKSIPSYRLRTKLKTAGSKPREKTKKLLGEAAFAASLVESTQAIAHILDTSGRIMRISPPLEKILGYRKAQVVGHDWFNLFVTERDREPARTLFKLSQNRLCLGGRATSIIAKDGTERKIQWFDKQIKDTAGKMVGLLGIGQDITEHPQVSQAPVETGFRYRSLLDLSLIHI